MMKELSVNQQKVRKTRLWKRYLCLLFILLYSSLKETKQAYQLRPDFLKRKRSQIVADFVQINIVALGFVK